MKWWLIFPIFILALVQTTIIGFNFLLVFVLVISLAGGEKESFLSAFISGLFLDLLAGSPLGLSSLAFLSLTFLAFAYKRKFQAKNLFFWIVIFLVGNFFFKMVNGQIWHWKEGLLMTALALVIYFVLDKVGVLGEEEEGIKLRI